MTNECVIIQHKKVLDALSITHSLNRFSFVHDVHCPFGCVIHSWNLYPVIKKGAKRGGGEGGGGRGEGGEEEEDEGNYSAYVHFLQSIGQQL